MPESEPILLESTSPEETHRIAAALGRAVRPPLVITLSGPLGAGKTLFVRGLAAGLGIDPSTVSSPTYVLSQEYPGDPTLVHIDAYRMRSPDDLESIGWDELLHADDLIIAVEWPERIADVLPAERISITLTPQGTASRAIEIRGVDELPTDTPGIAVPTSAAGAPIACRICGREVPPDSPDLPFCSRRCRMADLGRWFSGSYTVSRELEEDDLWEQ